MAPRSPRPEAEVSDPAGSGEAHRDRERFTTLVKPHLGLLKSFVRRRVRRSSVDGVVADTLESAWACKTDLFSSAEPAAFLLCLASRRVADEARRTARRARAERVFAADLTIAFSDRTCERLEAAGELTLISQALRSVTDTDRQLIRLATFGLSYSRIAELMAMTCDQVKWRLHQARTRLSKEVALERERQEAAGSGEQC